jgi:hypothetical protein
MNYLFKSDINDNILPNRNFTVYFSFVDRLQFPSNAYMCIIIILFKLQMGSYPVVVIVQ